MRVAITDCSLASLKIEQRILQKPGLQVLSGQRTRPETPHALSRETAANFAMRGP